MRRRMRRPGPAEGQDNNDRWMITYADLITLLLIFFVILYAMSTIDQDKYGAVTGSLQETFHVGNPVLDGGSGLLEGGRRTEGDRRLGGRGEPGGTAQATASPGPAGKNGGAGSGGASQPTERELAFREQERQLAELMNVITRYVEDNALQNQIFVADKPQGIAITLSDRFLFDVGRAELKPGALPALTQLSGLFRNINASISIEGHTDNTPVSAGSRYDDNWDLSGARALSVLRYFLEEGRLNPDSFQYAGYADTRPAADNSSAAGRAQNRRVEIIVLRQLQE